MFALKLHIEELEGKKIIPKEEKKETRVFEERHQMI